MSSPHWPPRADSWAAGPATPEPPAAPAACPICRSPRVTSTNAKTNVSTYWRCEACGEIWNPGRARSPYERR